MRDDGRRLTCVRCDRRDHAAGARGVWYPRPRRRADPVPGARAVPCRRRARRAVRRSVRQAAPHGVFGRRLPGGGRFRLTGSCDRYGGARRHRPGASAHERLRAQSGRRGARATGGCGEHRRRVSLHVARRGFQPAASRALPDACVGERGGARRRADEGRCMRQPGTAARRRAVGGLRRRCAGCVVDGGVRLRGRAPLPAAGQNRRPSGIVRRGKVDAGQPRRATYAPTGAAVMPPRAASSCCCRAAAS